MASTMGRLAAKKQSTVIEFEDDETLRVEFYPQRVSPKMIAALSDFEEAQERGMTNAEARGYVMLGVDILLKLLASWDLMEPSAEDETKPSDVTVPIDHEHVSDLGLVILWQIVGGIFQASQSGEAKGTK
ncbi:MAG: hypothetical protein ACXWQR_00540 [Ktedonobacterales bacterium]